MSSTIERAVNKINGVTTNETDIDDATESINPVKSTVTQEEESSTSKAPVIETKETGPVQIPTQAKKQDVQLDLERLQAAGFLVPGAPVTGKSEEFQQIKRRLLGNMVKGMEQQADAPSNLIMVTSAMPGEGKTFTSVNLALSLAMEMDRTVLAIDTDIIKSDMSKVLQVADRPGLYDLLEGANLKLEDLLVRTSIPNLVVLPAGHKHGAITEKLASQAMQQLTHEISTRYKDRVVIFDSPPVLATTGATALAPNMGQVLMVVEAEQTPQDAIKRALQVMDHVTITGLIFNKSRKSATGSGEDYGYGYYQQVNKD